MKAGDTKNAGYKVLHAFVGREALPLQFGGCRVVVPGVYPPPSESNVEAWLSRSALPRLTPCRSDDIGTTPSAHLVFKYEGDVFPVVVRERPLGVLFAKKMPMIVDEVKQDSVAFKLGISPGYALIKVGEFPLDDLQFHAAWNVLQGHMAAVPGDTGGVSVWTRAMRKLGRQKFT